MVAEWLASRAGNWKGRVRDPITVILVMKKNIDYNKYKRMMLEGGSVRGRAGGSGRGRAGGKERDVRVQRSKWARGAP